MATIVAFGPQAKGLMGQWIRRWAYAHGHAAFDGEELATSLHRAISAGNVVLVTGPDGEFPYRYRMFYTSPDGERMTVAHGDNYEDYAAQAAVRELEEILKDSDNCGEAAA